MVEWPSISSRNYEGKLKMANDDFLSIIVVAAQKAKDASELPGLFTDALPEASRVFLEELEEAGVSWASLTHDKKNKIAASFQPKVNNKHAVAIALFKFCLAQKTANDLRLYQGIITALNTQQINYCVPSQDKEIFFKNMVCVLANNSLVVSNFTLNDILVLMPRFEPFHDNTAQQAQLLGDAQFLSKHLPKHLKSSENDILNHPVIIQTLQQTPAEATAIMATLTQDASLFKDFIPTWLQLLKNNAIATDATPNGIYFLQYWYRMKRFSQLLKAPFTANSEAIVTAFTAPYSSSTLLPVPISDVDLNSYYSAAVAISRLMTDDRLKDLTPSTRAALLSLPCYVEENESYTPLQVLAKTYNDHVDARPITVRLIIRLLKENIPLAHEKRPFWFEILLPHLREVSTCDDILNTIFEERLQELYDLNIHIDLGKQLAERFRKQDFWTKEEKLSKSDALILHTLHKIEGARIDKPLPQEDKEIIDAFEKNLQSRSTQQAPYKITDYIANSVYARVNQITHQKFNTPATLENVYALPDAFYQKEIQISIRKSLILLEETFVFYDPSQKVITAFKMLLALIEGLLQEHGLEFSKIILDDPSSKAILKKMLTALLLFDDQEILKKTVLYRGIISEIQLPTAQGMDATTLNDIGSFLQALANAANTYKANTWVSKPGNTINKNCVDVIHAIWNDHSNLSFAEYDKRAEALLILAIKYLLILIHYRIISFTENTYLKSFYRDYLLNLMKEYPTQQMKAELAKYKHFFITQINACLKNINFKFYYYHNGNQNCALKKASLHECLGSFLKDFSIDISELDENAQDIFAQTDEDNIYFVPVFSHLIPIEFNFFIKIIKAHYHHQAPTVDDAKALVDYLVLHKYHGRKEIFAKALIKNLLGIKNETFNAVEYFLEKAQEIEDKYPDFFINTWLHCLNTGLTDTLIFKGKPFLFYLNNSPTELNKLLAHPSFNDLTAQVKTQILSASYTLEQRKVEMPKPQYDKSKNSANVQGKASGRTFNPATWHPFYDTLQIPAEPFTALQHLAIAFLLAPSSNVQDILTTIVNVLKHTPDIEQENNLYGYWIEILLVGMHTKTTTDKQFFIDHILTSTHVLNKILQTSTRQKIIDTLLKEADPLASSASDQKMYELYFLLLLKATFCYADQMQELPVFIEKICKHLMFYPIDSAVHQYFKIAYATLPLPQALKELIKDKIETADTLLVPSPTQTALYKIVKSEKNADDDTERLFAQRICTIVKEALFSSMTLSNTFLQENSEANLSDAMKKAIYVSIQKSITYSLTYENHTWHYADSMCRILGILNQLAVTLKLDSKQLLPSDYKKLLDHYQWANTYKKEVQLPEQFLFMRDNISKDHPMPDDRAAFLLTFLAEIVDKSYQYTQHWYHANKGGNAFNMECANYMSGLVYQNADASKQKTNFVQAMIHMIHYRINSYNDSSHEKSFYTNCLKEPLEKLKGTDLQLSEFCKQQFYYEIIEALAHTSTSKTSITRDSSLKDTLDLFITTLGLEQQFKDFDFLPYLPTACASGSVICNSPGAKAVIANGSGSSNSNNTSNSSPTNNLVAHKGFA